MTIEQKAKLYDEIVKERDAYAYLLGEFLERMAHLKYNGLHR